MTIGRRNLLGAALGAGGSAVSWPLSANAAPLTYDEAIKAARAPLRATPVHNELVRYATLAANSHNTQPWTFVAGATRMTIAPDFVRRCPAVDPDDHHLFASLGCAAENLVQAAAALGLKTSVVLEGDAIALDLEAASPVRSAQFEAITARQSTRAVYDGKPVASEVLKLLEAARVEPGVTAIMITDKVKISNVIDYVLEGNSVQMQDRSFMKELTSWMRFNETEALAKMEGLFARAPGNSAIPTWMAHPLLKLFFTDHGENQKYRQQIKSSAGMVVLVTDANDKAHWVAAGRACQRFGLQATAMGLKYAFINQPVEVAAVRSQFASFLRIGDRRPDIVLRFGAGPELPKSLRRAPGDVMREA